MAIGAILAIREIGLRIPQDIAGSRLMHDTDLASCMRPTLTTIHQPREELSLVTCERLLDLVQTSHAGQNPPGACVPPGAQDRSHAEARDTGNHRWVGSPRSRRTTYMSGSSGSGPGWG